MNGVSALELSAQLCNFKPGDEVVIPSHTFTASAYPYAKKGAKLVWADVDPVTHVVNAETIEKCITPRTKAIVVVHLYGYVADMPAIMEVAKRHNVLVIEDAAQSIGADLCKRETLPGENFLKYSMHCGKLQKRRKLRRL